MPATLWPEFVGGSYQTRARIMGADQAVNVYTETRRVPGSPKTMALYGTPGLKLEATLADQRCRGWFTQDAQTWCVFGGSLYERLSAGSYVFLGPVPDDGLPVTFASRGHGGNPLAISGGGSITVLNLATNVVSGASLPFTDPGTIVFQDGYGLVNEKNTSKFWFSTPKDFLTWDALDF